MTNLHLVGHSLGAHVVGFMAKKVQALGLGKLPRLTGLDPAYPCYELLGPEGRVDKTDAELVQIVHTNSGWLWEGCLSFKVNTRSALFCIVYGVMEPSTAGAAGPCGLLPSWRESPAGLHRHHQRGQPPDRPAQGETRGTPRTLTLLLQGGCSHAKSNSYFEESVHTAPGAGEG